MIFNEVREYWLPACAVLFNLSDASFVRVQDCYDLDELLGIDEYRRYKASTSMVGMGPLPDDLKSLLTAFAGPHGKALFKAYQIRKSQGVEP